MRCENLFSTVICEKNHQILLRFLVWSWWRPGYRQARHKWCSEKKLHHMRISYMSGWRRRKCEWQVWSLAIFSWQLPPGVHGSLVQESRCWDSPAKSKEPESESKLEWLRIGLKVSSSTFDKKFEIYTKLKNKLEIDKKTSKINSKFSRFFCQFRVQFRGFFL